MWVCDLVMSRSLFLRKEVSGVYQALYRKYRPQSFDDVIGQQSVTRTLQTQLMTGKLSHAYLFTGSRGTGKTTCAKILAKAVNCLEPLNGNPCNHCAACQAIDSGSCMDVLEIDAASNNGVDNVRDLRDDAIYAPAQVKKRVYIIDEVHMLSISAFNALLKIIEEPPEHLLFILATTELHKVPATILSRCQRFAFRRLSQEDVADLVQRTCIKEGIDITPDAANLLGRLADGAGRDGLSLLDQCASSITGQLTAEAVYRCLGLAGEGHTVAMLRAVSQRDAKTALGLFDELYAQGKDLRALLDEICTLARDLLILRSAPGAAVSMLSGISSREEARELAAAFTPAELTRIIRVIQDTLSAFVRSVSRRIDGELCILNLCDPSLTLEADALNARLTKLEEQIATGQFVQAAPQKPRSDAPDWDDGPPPLDDADAPPDPDAPPIPRRPAPAVKVNQPQASDAPPGFWSDLAAKVRPELGPTMRGFFTATPNNPVRVQFQGQDLILLCDGDFVHTMVNKPEILDLVAQKANLLLGRRPQVRAVDARKTVDSNDNMKHLLDFSKAHSEIVKIKK